MATDDEISRIGPHKSMRPFLEHLNMTSTDVDETVRFLLTAMPEFSIRGGGGGARIAQQSAGYMLALLTPTCALRAGVLPRRGHTSRIFTRG
jgi:hypothetical protein